MSAHEHLADMNSDMVAAPCSTIGPQINPTPRKALGRNSSKLSCCSREAEHSVRIRQVYIRPWLRQTFIQTGSRESQSARSMQQSSPAMLLISAWIDFAIFGRPSARRL